METTQTFTPETIAKLDQVASILKAIAHPLRIGIVQMLDQEGELPVNTICERLGSEQSLTSHHLQNLRLKGILTVRRDGRSMLYSLRIQQVTKLLDCLEECRILIDKGVL